MWTAAGLRGRRYACPMRSKTALLGLVLASLTLSGCSLFAVPETALMRPAGSGVDTTVGDILIQDTTLVSNDAGILSLSASLFNKGESADSLTAVLLNGVAAKLTPAEQTLDAGGVLRFGYNTTAYADWIPSAEDPKFSAVLTSAVAGTSAQVTYVFASGLKTTVTCIVVSHSTPMYSSVTPAPELPAAA
ncbi:MAG: hypothetical protein RIS43_473 [Actinomycetota bacterium]